MSHGLEAGFILDRQWFWLRGEMERTKRPALLALAEVFAEANVPYAIIGGVALQVHLAESRTTLAIDIAVAAYGQIPRAQLEAAGFSCTGRFSHSENWIGPEGTPVQFTDDPALTEAITRAEEIELENIRLRVISRTDLLHEKLRAASDPARRRSKRLQDLADAQGLLEATPDLAVVGWVMTHPTELKKGSNIASIDPEAGNEYNIVALFHPRKQHWQDHFHLQEDGRIVGTTPEGRAMMRLLEFNEEDRLQLRRALMQQGWRP